MRGATTIVAVLVAMAVLLAAATTLPFVDAASSCDVKASGASAGNTSAAFLKYSCSSLPFTTESVALKYTITSTSGDLIRVGTTSGAACTSYDAFYTVSSCLPTGDAVTQCNKTVYLTANSGEQTFCVVVMGYTSAATVDVDIEFTAATNSAQWHLKNTGQFGGTPGNDVNAEGAWSQGAYGTGVVVMIVDTGVQPDHVELSERLITSLSWNPESMSRNPSPGVEYEEDDHGTACAGVAAASNNSYCGQGAAPQASIAGYRIFGDYYSGDTAAYVRGLYYDEQSTDGTNRRVSINSNSWGPAGCSAKGCYFSPMKPQLVASIQNGADHGRNGLGVVYAFAAGNEGHYGGDANMYHYCKLPESMCIAASDFNGRRVYYSNAGANLFVNSPSQGQSDRSQGLWPSIITAQFSASTSKCMSTFGGTSSSTPLVAGIVAQILGVRPDLTYRDVQHIIQRTADRNDAMSPEWFQNGAGIWFSHHSGFGRINAGNAVSLAQKWTLIGDVCGTSTPIIDVDTPIADNDPLQPVISEWTFKATDANLPDTIESVMVYLTVSHRRTHDLRIKLTSPSGTTAILARPQKSSTAIPANTQYPFAARVFWGESPVGIWKLTVTDEIASVSGTFTNWAMEVQGTGNGTLPDRESTGGVGPRPGPGSSASMLRCSGFIAVITMMIATIMTMFV